MDSPHRRRIRFSNLPVAGLIALLQRTPVVQVTATAEEFVLASPAGTILRSAAAAAATLGALHSMAGATSLAAADTSGSVSTTSTFQATVGTPIPEIVFTILGTTNGQTAPGSWSVSGMIPPGLNFDGLSAPGSDNDPKTSALSGTPTTAGIYTMKLTGYEFSNTTSGNTSSTTSSQFSFTIDVSASKVAAPSFTTNPMSMEVSAGQMATFTAAATGSPTYQWQFNNNDISNNGNISGATTAMLTISSATSADAGSYTCVATNSGGSTTSSAAMLTVTAVAQAPVFTTQPNSQTINVGSTVVFTGVASGASTYQWQYNGSPLSDSPGGTTSNVISGSAGPQLVISNATAASNGSYVLVAANSVGPTSSNAASLAVASSPNPGYLINISARAFVGTGGNIMIGGFYVVGSTSRSVLIQAIGPGLAGEGVTGVLQHPALSIHNSAGATIYSNIGWGSSQLLLDAAAAAYANPVLQANSADSELFVTLPPGGYTAEISGADGGTGVALCAIYQLP